MTGNLFDGVTIDKMLDNGRLLAQMDRVKQLMESRGWMTLQEIAAEVNAPEASVSARLRDLRKQRHGGFIVERRRRGEPSRGLFEYRIAGGGWPFA